MALAAKSVVEQWRDENRGKPLTPLLPRARKLFSKLVRDRRDIQLREVDGRCEVIAFVDTGSATEKWLLARGLSRGADGVVVVASGKSWDAVLGSASDE